MSEARITTSIEPPPGDARKPGTCRLACELLARSFQAQPHFVDLFPEPTARARALPALFRALWRDSVHHGRVDLAYRGGQLAGVGVWYPPEAFPLSAGRQVTSSPHVVRMALAAPRSLPRVMRFQATAAGMHSEEPHWYLAALGVDPTMQGNGVGTLLVECALADVDPSGLPCYLETHTPGLVGWYQRLGFEVREAAVPLVPGGPPNWTMQRPGRRV